MKARLSNIFFTCSKKYFLLLIFIFYWFQTFASPAEWTVLVYVQANNNLKNYAQRNFSDMSTIGSSSNLNILVQTYFPQTNGTSRYKIEKGKMILDTHISTNSDGTKSNDLIDAMRWAVAKYPAKKYALVLWNHGIGILDPAWGNRSPFRGTNNFHIDKKILESNPRIQISDLTTGTNKTNHLKSDFKFTSSNELAHLSCQFDEIENYNNSDKVEECLVRGILFNEQTRNYMNNQSLTAALQEIKSVVLKNNKLDILGMDACLMAMVEVGYQARNFAHYLVASEEAELAHGWDYAALCEILSKNLSPSQVAQSIVMAYELCYKNKIQFYTQSAIDLTCMDTLKTYIDELAYNIKLCKNTNSNLTETLLKKSRNTCLQFSAASYIDLHSFCSEFINQINSIKDHKQTESKEFLLLKTSLQKISAEIEQAVIACTAGKKFSKVKGLSIYFPTHQLEQSYLQSEFGKNSAWTNLIIDNIKNN